MAAKTTITLETKHRAAYEAMRSEVPGLTLNDFINVTSEQLGALMRDPLDFFEGFSTWCHLKAEQQSEAMGEFTEEEVGPGKPWGATAELIDLAIELWREETFPADARRSIMTGHLESITRIVQSYMRP